MAEQEPSTRERLSRWYRNINIIGAVALVGAGVLLPEFQTILFAGAALNVAQAGVAEVVRRGAPEQRPSDQTA